MADLAGDELQALAVERPAERQGDLLVAEPAHLDDAGLEARDVQREAQAGFRRAGVEDDLRRRSGASAESGNRAPSASAMAARVRTMSISVTSAPARRPREITDQAADQPRADHRDASARLSVRRCPRAR